MNRHFPGTVSVSVVFADRTTEVFTGRRLNEIYDQALAAYRAGNHLDAKGFNRAPGRRSSRALSSCRFRRECPADSASS